LLVCVTGTGTIGACGYSPQFYELAMQLKAKCQVFCKSFGKQQQ